MSYSFGSITRLRRVRNLDVNELLEPQKHQVFECNAPLDLKFTSELRDHLRYIHPEMFYKKLEAKNSPLVENTVPMIKQILKKIFYYHIHMSRCHHFSVY